MEDFLESKAILNLTGKKANKAISFSFILINF